MRLRRLLPRRASPALGSGVGVVFQPGTSPAEQEEAVVEALRWNAKRKGQRASDKHIRVRARRMMEMRARSEAARQLDGRLAELRIEWKPFDAIRLIQSELGLSLPNAKQYLHDHPAWHDALVDWDETLDQVERDFDEGV
jgi:hypothetical protein